MSDVPEVEKVNRTDIPQGSMERSAIPENEPEFHGAKRNPRVPGNDAGFPAATREGTTREGQSSTTMSGGAQPGWHEPEPAHLPEPTYWPAVMALGITLIAWGVVTTWIITVVGLALFVLSLKGWIGEMLHENPEPGFPGTTRE